MPRPTVHDIAREAGVSLATVDRVLNARPGVRQGTMRRVLAAVDALGYVRDVAAADLARRRERRILFALPEGDTAFLASLRAAVAAAGAAVAADRIATETVALPARDPRRAATALGALIAEPPDGVAILAPETPQVRDAVDRLAAMGVPVVAIVSDLPSTRRLRFVGIDNRAAGRTAATLIGRFAAGRAGAVAVVASSTRSRDAVERRLGLDELLAARFPGLVPLPTVETHDDPDRAEALTAGLLAAPGGLAALYALGDGTPGVIRALERQGRPGPVVVAHDLTPPTRAALARGTLDAVIAQDVGHIARSALRLLRAADAGRPVLDAQERIRVEIVLAENAPPEDACVPPCM